MTTENTIDIDTLLDSDLDDLADLPSFAPFTPGIHQCKLTLALKEISGKAAIEAAFTYIATQEAVDPEAELPKEGDGCNLLFFLNNDVGQGKWKEFGKPLKAHFGVTSSRDVIDSCQDVEVMIVSGLRKNKEDPDKPYFDVKKIQVI